MIGIGIGLRLTQSGNSQHSSTTSPFLPPYIPIIGSKRRIGAALIRLCDATSSVPIVGSRGASDVVLITVIELPGRTASIRA